MNARVFRIWRCRHVSLALVILCAAVTGLLPERVHALELTCVEASRYRTLLQIFEDDPAKLSSYFRLDGDFFPDPAACRALLVTGTIRDGDAEVLLQRFIDSKGWLATLYLSLDGENVEEESRIAQLIRGLWLKTRFVSVPPYNYEPDFLPGIAVGEEIEAVNSADRPDPLRKAFNLIRRRPAQRVRVDPCRNRCAGSCPYLWAAGVSRLAEVSEDGIVRTVTPIQRASTERERRNLAVLSAIAPPVESEVRQKCVTEFAAAMGVEERLGADAVEFAHSDAIEAAPLLEEITSMRKAAARIEQCTAGVIERARLGIYARICGTQCGQASALAKFRELDREAIESSAARSGAVGLPDMEPSREPVAPGRIVYRDAGDHLDGELKRLPSQEWLETTKDKKTYRFCTAGESNTNAVVYDKSRDIYVRANFPARKISVLWPRARSWQPLYDIIEKN